MKLRPRIERVAGSPHGALMLQGQVERQRTRMASRPKEARLKRKLVELAKRDGRATPLDWVVGKIEDGVTVTALAREIAVEMGEPCSRNWVSAVINRLTPDAKSRISGARKEAAHFLIDEALSITDEPVATSAEVQRNRLRADARFKIAGFWDREFYGDTKSVAVQLDFGQLHLDALRTRNMEREVARIAATPTPALLAASEAQDE